MFQSRARLKYGTTAGETKADSNLLEVQMKSRTISPTGFVAEKLYLLRKIFPALSPMKNPVSNSGLTAWKPYRIVHVGCVSGF